MTNVMATRILFEPDTTIRELTAQGVEYLQDGVTLRMLCKREVVLCAGTRKSLQIMSAYYWQFHRRLPNAAVTRGVGYVMAAWWKNFIAWRGQVLATRIFSPLKESQHSLIFQASVKISVSGISPAFGSYWDDDWQRYNYIISITSLWKFTLRTGSSLVPIHHRGCR